MEEVIEILEFSIKKNGSIPLTTEHLLNILKMAKNKLEQDDRSDFSDDPNW